MSKQRKKHPQSVHDQQLAKRIRRRTANNKFYCRKPRWRQSVKALGDKDSWSEEYARAVWRIEL